MSCYAAPDLWMSYETTNEIKISFTVFFRVKASNLSPLETLCPPEIKKIQISHVADAVGMTIRNIIWAQ